MWSTFSGISAKAEEAKSALKKKVLPLLVLHIRQNIISKLHSYVSGTTPGRRYVRLCHQCHGKSEE
jgi:hypothetical protein